MIELQQIVESIILAACAAAPVLAVLTNALQMQDFLKQEKQLRRWRNRHAGD